MCNVINI